MQAVRELADHGHVKRVGCRWDDRQVIYIGAGRDKDPGVTSIPAAKQPYLFRDGIYGLGHLGMDDDLLHIPAIERGGVPHTDAQGDGEGIGQAGGCSALILHCQRVDAGF